MMKSAAIAASLLVALAQADSVLAYESGARDLGNVVGATDYYKIGCTAGANGDTDHLAFKITDTTPLPADAQVLNMLVTRKAMSADMVTVTPGMSRAVTLAGGNGKYKVRLDTTGTVAAGKQTYALQFQCLNPDEQPTKTSRKKKSGKLKLGKKKTVAVNCAKKRRTGSTAKLAVTLTNTTQARQVLTAQVFKGGVALNTTDGNEISVPGGNGDYYLTVDHTGTDPNQDNSRFYTFQSSCMNGADQVTTEPEVLQLQDQ